MPTIKKIEDGVNGCVFFLRVENTDHVFIGASTVNNPRMRYKQLSCLFPYKLELIGWLRTGIFLSLHSKLEAGLIDEHILNGWYNLPPDRLATIFSVESGYDVLLVKDMVLKRTVVALDCVGGVVEEEVGSVEAFMSSAGYIVGDGREILFRTAYREYVLTCDEPISIGAFRREVSNLGFKRTYDNGGFFVKKGI